MYIHNTVYFNINNDGLMESTMDDMSKLIYFIAVGSVIVSIFMLVAVLAGVSMDEEEES